MDKEIKFVNIRVKCSTTSVIVIGRKHCDDYSTHLEACISLVQLSLMALFCRYEPGSQAGYQAGFQVGYQAGFRVGSDNVGQGQKAFQWTLSWYPLDRNVGIPGPFMHRNRLPTHKCVAMQPQLYGGDLGTL